MPRKGGGGHATLAALALALLAGWPAADAKRAGRQDEALEAAVLEAAGRQRSASNEGSLLSKAEQAQRLSGLAEVEQDLESTEQLEDSDLKKLEQQISGMVQKRDALRRSEARRQREIAFLQSEVARLQGKLQASAGVASGSGAQQTLKATQASGLSGASAANAASASAATAASASAAAAVAASAAAASSVAADTAVASVGSLTSDAVAASSGAAVGTAEHTAEQALAKEAAQRQQQEEQARRAREAAAIAAARAQRLATEEKQRKAEEARQKANSMAESADDSFKQFMKEEDGEDQMGDADYEDSANALAGAIGWNRKEIESKADKAVKQLTEAIGGKKVIQSVQGMMAGIR